MTWQRMSELANDLLHDNAEWVPAERRSELHASVVAIIEDALFEETTGRRVDDAPETRECSDCDKQVANWHESETGPLCRNCYENHEAEKGRGE